MISVNYYGIKEKFLADLEANPFKSLRDFSAEYGISARTLKIYAKESSVYWMRRMRHDDAAGNQAALIDFYQEAPCLLEDCLPEFGNPSAKSIRKTMRINHILDWGKVKLSEKDLRLDKFEYDKIDEKVAYLLAFLVTRTYIAVDQWDNKVVFLYFPKGMEQSRGLMINMLYPHPITLHNSNKDVYNKLILESDFLYDLVKELRYDMMYRTLPKRIPRKFKLAFYRGIFDSAAKFIFIKRRQQCKNSYWVFLRLYGNGQMPSQCLDQFYKIAAQGTRDATMHKRAKVNYDVWGKPFVTWNSNKQIRKILQYIYKDEDQYYYNSRMRVYKDDFLKWKDTLDQGKRYKFIRRW